MESPGAGRNPQALTVVHVAAPGVVGGLETVVRLLARAQVEAGLCVHVAVTLESDPGAHPFVRGLREDGLSVLPIVLGPRAYWEERRSLLRAFRNVAPTVVHCHGARSDVIGGWAAGNFGVPRVTTVHGFTGGGPKNRFYEWLQTAVHRRFEAVVAVSEPLLGVLAARRVPQTHLHLIRNAWAPTQPLLARDVARKRLGLSPDAFVAGWVGRISREKGLDLLLEGLPLSADGLQLAVIGEGPERDSLAARATALGVAGRIRWCGEVLDAAAHFRAFDVLVLSSRTEGTPMVLFEAMSAGVPIIAAAVGGVPDVLAHDAAWLVPSEAPAALMQAIGHLRFAAAEGVEKAGRARMRLESEFGVGPWVARYNEVYASVIPGPAAREGSR